MSNWDDLPDLNVDLSSLTEDEVAQMLESRLSDDQVDELADKLQRVANETADERQRVARILSTLSTVGGIALRVVKVVT